MSDSTGRGHGGLNAFDQGAVGSGTTEYKEVSWINDYWLKATKVLKDVSDFAATNVNQNLINIVNNTNKISKSVELTFSQHLNAFNGKATGVEVWYYLGDAKGKRLAEQLSAAISKALGLPNRGAKATTSLYVVSYTNATCLLIEWCFVDNASDMAAYRTNKVKAMDAALKVIGYSVSSPEPSKPTPPAPGKTELRHWVLTGTYTKGGSAEKKLKDFITKEKMGHATKTSGDKITYNVGYFGQGSPWKRKLEEFLVANNFSYELREKNPF